MTITEAFAEHMSVVAEAANRLTPVIARVADTLYECLKGSHLVLACGNGGSAADAEHLVAELVGRFRKDRPALRAVTLTAGGPTITALANDYGYSHVFRRQIEALASPGDLLFAISTSGNSENVVQAARAAKQLHGTVVALAGGDGGRLATEADLVLLAPSHAVARIQEVHGLCIHTIVEALEARLGATGEQ